MLSASLPIVAQVTIDEDGNCLDGSDPETFVPKLEEWGADVIGCNCSVGPVAMLDAMERVRAATSLPLAAQPNAGIPRSVDGRNIYLCSPEYMASYARKFVAAGVRLVGGCCGTTPEHIRVMKSALRVGEARAKSASAHVSGGQPTPQGSSGGAAGEALAAGREAGSRRVCHHGRDRASKRNRHPQGDRRRALSEVGGRGRRQYPRQPARLGAHEQSGAVAADSARGRHRGDSALHLPRPERAVHSKRPAGRGRGRHPNLICITGDPPKMGNYPDATAVFDVDAIGLVNIVHNLNRGLDLGGNPIGTGTGFVIGVGANPGLTDLDEEIRRFEYKVEAGAEYVVTQPVFDLRLLENFLQRIEHCRIPVVAGIWPLISVRNAEFMKNELRVSVPDRFWSAWRERKRRKPRGGRRRHRARDADCCPSDGAGRADQRPAGAVQFRRGRSRGASGPTRQLLHLPPEARPEASHSEFYLIRSAAIGSTPAARRAGM